MVKRAQSALEYLMTYGWTLIVVALIVGVLVFVVSPPESVSFDSDNSKILVKDGFVGPEGEVDLILLNGTGGMISVTSAYLLGDFAEFGDATVNGLSLFEISPANPLVVQGGEELKVDNVFYAGSGLVDGSFGLDYKTRFGLSESVFVSSQGSVDPTFQSSSLRLIGGCQDITESGIYVLSQDLVNTSGVCITINADNVVLNCGRKGITGASNDYHIDIRGDNVTVMNCELSGTQAIWILGNNVNINNNTFATTTVGIIAMSSSLLQIRHNDFESGSSYNLYVSGISNSSITHNTLSGSIAYGAFLHDSSDNVSVSNNSFCGSATSDVICSSFTASGSGNRLDTINIIGDCSLEYSPC